MQRTEFIHCDLGDMLQVKRVVRDIRKRTDRLDILICNAGMRNQPLAPFLSIRDTTMAKKE